jgi:hypothetical protein
MLKKLLYIAIISLFAFSLFSETDPADFSNKQDKTKYLLSLPLPTMLAGVYTGSLETKISDTMGLIIEPAYFNIKWSLMKEYINFIYSLTSTDEYIDINGLWDAMHVWMAGSGLGISYYPDKHALNGLYINGSIMAYYLTISTDETLNTPAFEMNSWIAGASAVIGYRWIWNWLSAEVFGGVAAVYLMMDYTQLFNELNIVEKENYYTPTQFNIAPTAGLALKIAL